MNAAFLALIPLVACGEKETPPGSNMSAKSNVSLGSLDIPKDAKSKDFAKNLLGAAIKDFQPTDGGGAKLVYSSMRFAADNTWKASAYVKVEDLEMECTESGGWTMTAADSGSTATVTWKVDATDCVGRSSGSETRALITLSGGAIKDIKFR